MQNEDSLMLTQDLSCSILNDITIEQIEESLKGVFANMLKFCLNNPEYIQPYTDSYKIWKIWRR